MKDSKTIFQMNKVIEEKQKKLQEELVVLKEEQEKLQHECQHDIVFRLYDNSPRKIGIIYHYFCPACNSIETLHMNRTLENSPFENSRIIVLNGLSIMNNEDYKETIDIIQNEVLDNYNYYYNKDVETQRLTKSMSEAIIEQRKKHIKIRTIK